MKSKSVVVIACVVFVLYVLLFALRVISRTGSPVEAITEGVVMVFVLFALSTLLKNQEIILDRLKRLSSGGGESGEKNDGHPIPVPRLNQNKRLSAIRKIRKTDFEPSKSCTVNNYNVAVDAGRREWIIIPPDGKDVQNHSFSHFKGYHVMQEQDVAAVCVFTTTCEEPYYIVIASGTEARVRDLTKDIQTITGVLDAIQ